nr:leucine--tRNA ligase [Candidatus Njordarchaeota archaeon]
MATHHLDFGKIEMKWQKRWEEARIFEADVNPSKPKFFITVAYPYVNAPQHIGHGRTYGLTDVYARYKRMRGFNVLYPQGFHYTGTPILGMVKRLAKQDSEIINEFNKIFHIPLDIIRQFSDPLTLAKYFHNELKLGMKEMGYSIDWRREFTTVDPIYSQFIQWQFRRLSSKGYLVKGTHPVGWCPSDKNPVGQHDTQGDVEPEIAEVTLLKFKSSNGIVLPVATYRPETIFGVTNIWVNPEIDYHIVEVDREKWLASKECFEKLKYQSKNVDDSKQRTMHGSDLIGEVALNPETGGKCLVLPASFVDPKTGTGVVMSVPGHAPYDYLALSDLKKADILDRFSKQYRLDPSRIKQISPISIIKISGYSDYPAGDVVERMNLKSQTDPKAEEATKEIYLKEFNEGVMKENTGKYGGMKVSKAKDQVKYDLEKKGTAEKFYELTSPVRCRCGSECVVRVLENQWFINYGDVEWKKAVSQHLERMRIVPDDLRQEYKNTIEWLRYRACARQSGLGTKLPQAPEWTIESLSDSTIYMAYYTISKHIREHDLKEGQFKDNVFDYIFLGKGNPDKLAGEVELPKNLLESMRKEFLYWYPLDSRHSATELIPNHLTFFIFNHVAIFPMVHWPRQIVTNGMVLMEGKKMSKSIGNIIPIRDAIRRYGADTIKIAVLGSAELLSDANFSNSLADTIRERLEKLYNFVVEVTSNSSGVRKGAETKQFLPLQSIDRWILSVLQYRVAKATEAMEKCEVREGIQQSFFLLDLDLSWYLRRTSAERANKEENDRERAATVNYVLTNVVDTWIRLLAPFAPHICEEAWEKFNRKGFVSNANWPSLNEKLVDVEAEEQENYLMKVSEDTREIIRVTNIKPKKIFYYTSPKWMHDIYKLMLEARSKDQAGDVSMIIRGAMSKPFAKGKEKVIAKYIQSAYNSAIKIMPRHLVERRIKAEFNEKSILEEALEFLKNQFSTEFKVFDAEDRNIYDPAKKASFAQPYRPSIYIEN